MKKNFFKKLSFVMALAMIISVIAPAAGAFAATGLRLNATSKTLFLGESTKSFNFNPLGMSKGATQKWTSSKPSVATVNAKNGVVTAKATGTTTITATITNAKKTVTKKLTAKVTVGDNVKTLNVAVPADADAAKLAVGTDYKLATSYVTKGGSKTKTSNTFAWSVDKEGATVSKTGVFKATTPGEYTVTVTANRYKNVKVTAATIKLTVVPGIVSTKQYNANKVTVTFDSDMSATDVKTTATISKVVNGVAVSTGTEKVKSVTLDSTGKVATVELYANLVAGTTYNFNYGTLKSEFKAAATDIKNITGLVFDDFNVDTTASSTDMLQYVHAVNADGVIIAEGADIASYLEFTYSGDVSKGFINSASRTIYINSKGYAAPVKVKFSNFLYNETTKAYETVTFEDAATATGNTPDTNVNNATVQNVVISGTVPGSTSDTWTKAVTLAAKDTGYRIVTRYKLNNQKTTDAYTVADANGKFTYESTNKDILLISGTTVYPVAAGTVTIIVRDTNADKTVVGTFDVTIAGARTFANVSQDVSSLTIGNIATAGVAETKSVTFTVKDTLNSAFQADSAVPTIVNRPSGVVTDPVVTLASNPASGDDLGKIKFNVTAANATVGVYNVKVEIKEGDITKTVYFAIEVVSSTLAAGEVPTYRLELSGSSFDLKEVNNTKYYTVSLNGYNTKGARVAVASNTNYDITVKDAAGNTENVYNAVTGIAVVGVSSDSVTLVPLAVDNYVVTATVTGSAIGAYTAGSTIGAAAFAVVDTTTKTVTLDANVVALADAGTLLSAVRKAFSFSLNGAEITEANITDVKYSEGATGLVKNSATPASIAAGDAFYIAEVEYTVTDATTLKNTVYTYTVGQTITIK
jgi:hypothetical protein